MSADMVSAANRLRLPFNVSVPAQEAARAALDDRDFLARTVSHNERFLPRLVEGALALGLTVQESVANFALIGLPVHSSEVCEKLLRRGYIVRSAMPFGMPNHIRVTVGLEHEIDGFLTALGTILSEGSSDGGAATTS